MRESLRKNGVCERGLPGGEGDVKGRSPEGKIRGLETEPWWGSVECTRVRYSLKEEGLG